MENFEDKHEAVRDFEFHYEEKTGNRWKNRKDFKKVAGKFRGPKMIMKYILNPLKVLVDD